MSSKSRKVVTGVRITVGLLFAASGVMGLLQASPAPPLPEAASRLMGALAATGYFFPLLKATELAGGALLVLGLAVPFALVLLAPVVVNIAAFHLFLAPGGLPVAAFLVAAELGLAWAHREAFAPLFRRQAAGRQVQASPAPRPLSAAA